MRGASLYVCPLRCTSSTTRKKKASRTNSPSLLLSRGMLPSHGEHAFKKEDFSAAGEARACCGIMSAKEFLIVASIFLILCDLCDIYGNVVRVTGWTHLPFPGNITEMYYTQIKELNWYDLIISIIDAWCAMLLCLAVCAESLDGLVCSLCGFASSMILELVYVLWLSALVLADSVEEVGDAHTAAQLLFSDRDAESRPQLSPAAWRSLFSASRVLPPLPRCLTTCHSCARVRRNWGSTRWGGCSRTRSCRTWHC